MSTICNLGRFAEEAIKAGYKNADGTANLLLAEKVTKKFGRLIPKDSLSGSDLKEFQQAINKMFERLNLKADVFQKM